MLTNASPLHQAVKRGDTRGVSALFAGARSQVDIDGLDRRGCTPVMLAVANSAADIELSLTLLQRGAKADDIRILTRALRAGDQWKVAVLIEAGAKITYQSEHGYDALVDAVHGRAIFHDPHLIELLSLLIANGVSLTGIKSCGESGVRVLSRLVRFGGVDRILQVAGEHEDYCDPAFCIFDDMFVHEPGRTISIFGYPESVDCALHRVAICTRSHLLLTGAEHLCQESLLCGTNRG
jgi:hypothetical protein